MRPRSRPDDRVAEAAQRRLEALVAELGGRPPLQPEDEVDGSRDAEGVAADVEPEGGSRTRDEDEAFGRHARRPVPSSRRAVSWAGDRLPASVAGLRVGARHVAVVGVLLVAGLVLAGWTYVQATRGPVGGEVAAPRASGGVQVPAPDPSTGASAQAAGTADQPAAETAPGTTSAAPAEVVVDVGGKVRRPGIAVLPPGSRVVDALEAVGGPRAGADLRDLNLARLLVDGEQLLVGVDPPAGVAAGSLTGPSALAGPPAGPTSGPGSGAGSVPGALVDLNTADQAALETLPGVGPVTAAAILEWRTQHGAFTSVDELLEVSGIGDATLAEIAPHVTL